MEMDPIKIAVDLTETHRRLMQVQVDLPVHPGRTAKLTTPLWICEAHKPLGPISAIAGLFFVAKADGRKLRWRRDPKAPYIYLVDVPSDVPTIRASFDAVVSMPVTRRMAILAWEMVLLHPADASVSQTWVQANVTIPQDWSCSTALRRRDDADLAGSTTIENVASFAPVTLERLQDSPILAGQHMNEVAITPDQKHIFCLASDDEHHTTVPQSTVAKLRRLVAETHSVFGDPPYATYRFLATLSNVLVPEKGSPSGGWEHTESCYLLAGRDLLSDPDYLDRAGGQLIAHEYCHAWNGKYRRPAGHVPDDFTTPLDGSMLWVYEGLTQYYGFVIAVRSGLTMPSTCRTALAISIADMACQSGRLWHSIADGGAGVSLGSGLGHAKTSSWENWTRGSDYYKEGPLIWLDVDTLIRQKSGGRRCLDDFAQKFFSYAESSRGVTVVPYTPEELEQALNDVQPHDWATFFKDRVLDVAPEVNTQGVERAGYQFTYADEVPEFTSKEESDKLTGNVVWYSIGVRIGADGKIEDVRRYGPADLAKLAPQQSITHVGDEPFSLDALVKQIRLATGSGQGIRVTLKQEEDSWTADIHYRGGMRYPSLVRTRDQPDVLAAIFAPLCDVSERSEYVLL